ncbi:phosphate signaling complex protein PhoU [Chondromyces apiculatus]|uniref:Phosphate-specific transport system accessory protein PhoU n=1 Tax=Chondromyces apiculatus DSM 436 TaxID=1192034 RepID=A0A017T820_9BACT|nr:phosphate signaling complex protein PhoU [Chondromyces apiculatus]EYF05413.1 Phosphate transport system regulatory protein PhoU [Chondromyces apiculatus DSM 436]
MPTHTSKVYEHELRTLRDKLLLMGSLVEEMIHKGQAALSTRDSGLAKATIRLDRRCNRLECEVDELCMRILATRQPVASDLRFVTAALKIVTDLERIGDLVVNICERVEELNEESPLQVTEELTSLSEEAAAVVREALDALVSRDVERAQKLLSHDDHIDDHYARIFQDVLALMSRDPSTVYRATRVQSVAKYLERIADHAMNIAESVVFLVNGRDIRHYNRLKESDPLEVDHDVRPPQRSR